MSNSSKKTSTFDREMKNAEFKKAFEKSYKKFLISELLLIMMNADDQQSVRKLAKAVHLSPTAIQNLRSNKQNDIKMKNFLNITRACGYHVVLEKDDLRIILNQQAQHPK